MPNRNSENKRILQIPKNFDTEGLMSIESNAGSDNFLNILEFIIAGAYLVQEEGHIYRLTSDGTKFELTEEMIETLIDTGEETEPDPVGHRSYYK